MEWWSKLKRIMGVPEDEFMTDDEVQTGMNDDIEGHRAQFFAEKERDSFNTSSAGSYEYREPVRREQPRREARAETRREPRKTARDERYVNINATAQLQVILVKPEDFSESPQIADHLINKKTVLLNVEGVDRETVRRMVDFLSGVAYGQGGALKRVANATFIITPYDVIIMGDVLDELKMDRSIF